MEQVWERTARFKKDITLKMKFSIKDFFGKCDQIRKKLRIWSHLLKKSLMKNFIFCAVRQTLMFVRSKPMMPTYILHSHEAFPNLLRGAEVFAENSRKSKGRRFLQERCHNFLKKLWESRKLELKLNAVDWDIT